MILREYGNVLREPAVFCDALLCFAPANNFLRAPLCSEIGEFSPYFAMPRLCFARVDSVLREPAVFCDAFLCFAPVNNFLRARLFSEIGGEKTGV